ncbi:adenosylcobinamide-GDP ribazoletransferase [Loktanella ponticola]|uniref:Adenosylcobinamide-GDP ribazoletransferase n=1 Tax=Yoonia ponticola TaxID=1524255 RepID=A0A7W9BMG0_9RHOB|nr:adenosylcobinamide-GDP ribazoletransferase [Yoonia ponticola]
MAKRDMIIMHWHDIPAAAGLLTRVPVQVNTDLATQRGPLAAWAYPLVGLKIALAQMLVGLVMMWFGITPQITAGLMLATSVILTGAMHEDGLADSADGLWGGWDKAKRLAIMKDSHTGAYGVLAIVLSMIIRWAAITAILQTGHWIAAIIATAMLSRAAMVALMTGLPNARDAGLSQSVGRPKPITAWLAIGTATLGSAIAVGLTASSLLIVAAVTTSLWAGVAHRKIGGQTGDILGASQQLTEIALLITLSAVLSPL